MDTRLENTHRVFAHQTTLAHRLRFQNVTVMDDDALHRLCNIPAFCGLLLLVRQDFCMEFCKE